MCNSNKYMAPIIKRIFIFIINVFLIISGLVAGSQEVFAVDDWLHYSIDLKWDIADESQKYNQKVITASTAVLQPTYTLTIQTSSVNYEVGKMEIRLPYYMFTKRTTSENQDGTPAVYNPPKLAPAMIPVPEYPAEAIGNQYFSYYFDEATEELVFINTKYIPAGSNQTIQVSYEVIPNYVVDLDIARFQAKGKATPQDEEDGSYHEEERVSPEITYQLDTGLSSMTVNESCTKGTGFEPVKIEDGYRYYKALYRKIASGNQPFYKTPTFVLNNGGEILGPEENYNSKTVMTPEEASAYYSEKTFVDPDGHGSNQEGAIFDPAEYFYIYVRYPDGDEEVEDTMRITCNVVAWDDDSHQEPEDMNDRLSSYTDYKWTWTKNPDKPRGLWYKNPINQDRGRVDFLLSRPIYEAGRRDPHGPALFRIGVEDDHVVYVNQGNIGKLVITDTGLKQEKIVDGINGIAEPNDSPYLNYEICGVYLPILYPGTVKRYNEATSSVEAYDGEWFDEVLIEGSKDGVTWEEVYRTSNKNDPMLINSTLQNRDYYFDGNIHDAWVGKGYRQCRVSFLGMKENIVLSNDIVHVYMHGLDKDADYVLREPLDKYTNWVDIDIYDDQDESRYHVKDWGMLTLYPLAEKGNANITKYTDSIQLDDNKEDVHVEFSIKSNRTYSFANTGSTSPTGNIGKLMYEIKQNVPEAFENLKDYDDLETLVTYDLLPEGYEFEEFIGSDTFTSSKGAYINIAGSGSMYAQFITPKITTIDNYKGTNRQMVIFNWDVKKQVDAVLNNECSVYSIEFDFKYMAKIKTEDLIYYQNEHNLVCEQRGDNKEFFGGQEDDGDPTGHFWQNMSVFTDVKDENGDYVYNDVNEDGITDKKDTIYTYSTVSPNVPMSAATGIQKHIKGDSGKWTDLDHTDINEDYYYRVRVANGSTTHITDLIIYDTLEEAANTELHTGEVTWKGSFKSIDVHQMVNNGYAPVVYYSTADPSELDYNLVTGRDDNIWIDDTSIWSTTCPSDPSTVTAVAVDVRKMADGSDVVLNQNEGVEFIITMQAPPEYPTLSNPDMVYAINRPAYHSYQYVDYAADGEYFTDIGRRVKIYLEPRGSLTVKKVSENKETPADTRFNITGPDGFSDTVYYRDMVNGEYKIEKLALGTYTIQEVLPSGEGGKWDVTFDGAANPTQTAPNAIQAETELNWDEPDKTVTITNTSRFADLKGTKTWSEREDVTNANYEMRETWDGETYPSSRNAHLIVIKANNEPYEIVNLNEQDTEWSINDLPIKDDNDEEIEYTVEELVRPTTYLRYSAGRGSITTVGVPIDIDGDEVELKLYRRKQIYYENESSGVEIVDTKTVNKSIFEGNNNVLWNGLIPWEGDYDYTYYVAYDINKTNYKNDIDKLDITNTRLMDVTATKTWDIPQGDNTPAVTLVLNKTVNNKTSVVANSEKIIPANATGEALSVTWNDLPEYENGYPITYTVSEKEGEGYKLLEVSGNDIEGFTVKNTITTKVEGKKVWDDNDDQDGIRPESITVKLLADGEAIDEAIANKDSDWKYAFTNLPKYKNGKEIVYTVDEVDVDGYTKTIDDTTITNSHTPETTEVIITKTWDDKSNQDGKRPTEKEFLDSLILLANDKEVDMSKYQITSEDNGDDTYTIKVQGLPKNEKGEEIIYALDEKAIDGYELVDNASPSAKEFALTNKHEVELVDIPVTKTWDDRDNESGSRPESITVSVLDDGEVVANQTIYEKDGWKYTFTDLPKYKEGKEIEYTIREDKVERYITSITDTDITNITRPWFPETPQEETTYFSIVKNAGDGIDKNKAFKIRVKIAYPSGESYEETITLRDSKSSQDVKLYDIVPIGSTVTISEADTGYDTKYVAIYESGEKLNTNTVTVEKNKPFVMNVNNELIPKKDNPETRDNTQTGLYLTIFGISALLALCNYYLRKRYQ